MAIGKIIGGKGGGSSSFKQTPDNLRSNDTFEGVVGLCVGPIKGPTRGLKSIKLDGTAIENTAGTLNFPGFIATMGNGDPAQFPQKIQLKLGAGAAPDAIGLSLGNTNPSGPGPWVTQTLANTGADYIDLRFIVNQLYRQDKKGIYNATATIEVEMKPVGSATWINPTIGTVTHNYNEQGQNYLYTGSFFRIYLPESYYDSGYGGTVGTGAWVNNTQNYVITGKTTSPVVYELRIAVPNEDNYENVAWDIRARLIEKESVENDPIVEKRMITWESMAAVYGKVMGEHEDWRGLAWLQLYGKASDQLTGVPEITGEYDTKIVSVPPGTVYNPDTRQYTGTLWDGSWTKAFTNDPAWVINDAISDPISGLSLIAQGSYLNKWDALEASKWFSQLVDNGAGGTHPRYSLNLATNEPQKAEEFIRYLAGAVGGLAWDQGDGEWRLKVDKPEVAVDIFTLDNIEGEFVYSHTDVDTRFNDITGTFKNAEMDYRQDSVRLFNNTSIAAIGRKPTNIALVGCTNRQEALRRIKLRLESTVSETRMVTFTTNRRGRMIQQLDTVLVADGDLGDSEQRSTGRAIAVAVDGLSLQLRDTIRLEVGVDYLMHFSSANPDYDPEAATDPTSEPSWNKPVIAQTREITNTSGQRGNVTTLYLDEALPAGVDENLSISLEAVGLPTTPKQYRVLTVAPNDDNPERIVISAIEINVDKWDNSDTIDPDDLEFQDLRGAVPPPLEPEESTEMFQMLGFVSEYSIKNILRVNWKRPATIFFKNYHVQMSFNGSPWQDLGFTSDNWWEIQAPEPGFYSFRIMTVDRRDLESMPLEGTFEVTEEALIAPTALLTNETETVATNFDGSGGDYGDAGGEFKLYSPAGPITDDIVFSVAGTTGGLDIDIDTDTGVYTVNDLTLDKGTATLRAVWNGFTIDKIYSISKAKAGADGTPAKLVKLNASNNTWAFDLNENVLAQTITWTPTKQGSTAAIRYTIKDSNGAILIDGTPATVGASAYFDNPSSDLITMTHTQFASFIAGAPERRRFTVTAYLTGDTGVSDTITIVAVVDTTALLTALNDLLDRANAAADDNILTGEEKRDIVIPLLSGLDAVYAQLYGRATNLGVSTTALTNAKNSIYSYFDNFKGANWRNTDVDTPLSVEKITVAYPNSWGMSGTPVKTASGPYWIINDDSAAAYESLVSDTFAVTAGQTVTAAIVFEKDAIPMTTRVPLLRIQEAAGTIGDLTFDTSTLLPVSASGGTSYYALLPLSETECLAIVSRTMGAGIVGARIDFLPAVGTNAGYNPATTGSVKTRNPTAVIGSSFNLGRDLFRALLYDYRKQLDLLNIEINKSMVSGLDSMALSDPMSYATVDEFRQMWDVSGAVADISIVASNDTDGRSVKVGNNSGNDYTALFYKKWLPYSPEDLYEVAFDLEFLASGASAIFYLGVQAVDRAGNNLGGSYNYVAAAGAGQVTNAGRRTYRGYFRGTANVTSAAYSPNRDDPGAMPDGAVAGYGQGGTVQVRPMMLLNYNDDPGQCVVHNVSIRKLVDASTISQGNWDAGTTYYTDDGVTYFGRYFGAKIKNVNQPPPNSPTSNTYWYFISESGVPGGEPWNIDYLSGISRNGNQFTKTGNTNGAWDSALKSTALKPNASVSFRALQTNGHIMIGLTADDTDDSYTHLDYSIYFVSDGTAEVRENGTNNFNLGSYTVNDWWTVRKNGTVIQYLKNGNIVYTSTIAVAANALLRVDSSFHSSFGMGVEVAPIVADSLSSWRAILSPNISRNGASFARTAGASTWDVGFYSVESFVGAKISFRPRQTNAAIMIGLNSDAATDFNYTSIDYAMYATAGGGLYAYENGSGVSIGTYVAGDVLSVEHIGTTIQYKKNGGVPLRTVTGVSADLSLRADSSFYNQGYVDDVSFSGARAGDPGDDAFTVTPSVPAVAIPTDVTGNPTAGLPKTIQFKAKLGDADVTASATWPAAIVSGCAVTNLGGGAYRIDTVSADSGSFSVTPTYSGRSDTSSVTYSKTPAGAPSQRVSDTSISNVTSGSFVVASDTLTLNLPADATMSFGFGMGYDISGSPADGASGRKQIRFMARNVTDGGSFTQVGSTITGSYAVADYIVYPTEPNHTPGYVGGGTSLAGSVATKVYEVRLEMLHQGATVVQSGGNFTVSVS